MASLLNRILPREASFFDIFGALAENVHASAKAFIELLEEFNDVPARVGLIKEYEHKGDDMTHTLMTRLNQTFITPMDREDIHALASAIDDVVDLIDASASRLVLYRVDTVRPGVVELARKLGEATAEVVAAVGMLEKQDQVLQHCIEINRLENECDRICRTLIAQLFEEEKDPVQIIKWKEIIETMETATDKCEDVANVLESVVLKSG